MRIAFLTTDTTHHLYFAWKLAERYPLAGILLETKGISFPFETAHPFESERDEFERGSLLAGCDLSYEDLAPVISCTSANDADGLAALRGFDADVAVVFGTGKLYPEAIATPRTACLNLHGGNPELYRGLDSHLWAIYHGDWANLVTTLHHVAPELDTGELVGQGQIRVTHGMGLHELRAANTRLCLDLTLCALDALAARGSVPSRSQVAVGRYYSAMPAVLKDVCVRRFARYTASV